MCFILKKNIPGNNSTLGAANKHCAERGSDVRKDTVIETGIPETQ